MKKVQREWGEISNDLGRCLSACNLSNHALSKGTGLSYHSCRRYLLSGRVKNDNASARELCRFFKVPTEKTAKSQTEPVAQMNQAIQETWDGSESHAKLIIELIKTTKRFKIGERSR